MNILKNVIKVIVAFALVATMSACGASGSKPDNGPQTSASAAAPDGSQKWGDGWQYADGLIVGIGAPSSYVPSEYAVGTTGFTRFYKFTIRVQNDTQSPYDPASLTILGNSGGTTMSRVFDNGIIDPGSAGKIMPGRSYDFAVVFGILDPSDITITLAPDFTHMGVVWQGSAG